MAIYGKRQIQFNTGKTSKAVENNRAEKGVCGMCRSAYRSTHKGEEGKVVCGTWGHEIKDPFGEGCKKWLFRHKGQPTIGDTHTPEGRKFNEQLARYVKVAEARTKLEEAQHRRHMAQNKDPFGWGVTKSINFKRKGD